MTATPGSKTSQLLKKALALAFALLLLEVNSIHVTTQKIKLTFNSSLKKLPLQISAPHSRSLSPWESITSEDRHRIPKSISQASCLKQGCIGPDGEEDLGLVSVPIQYEVLVLKRLGVKVKGPRKLRKRQVLYQPTFQVITVGCTCVRPNVVRHE